MASAMEPFLFSHASGDRSHQGSEGTAKIRFGKKIYFVTSFLFLCAMLPLELHADDGRSELDFAPIFSKPESIETSANMTLEARVLASPPSMQLADRLPREQGFSDSVPDPFATAKEKKWIDEWGSFFEISKGLPTGQLRKMASRLFYTHTSSLEPVKQIENIEILGEEQNEIPLRIYIPKGATPLPSIVYFHSGGWVAGNIDDSDSLCRKMAAIFGSIVISVEYRLAPEYPFPSAVVDCYGATKWVSENIDSFGGDHHLVFVCGTGAGGNLAAAVALRSRDRKDAMIYAQILLYPPISALQPEDVYTRCPDRILLTQERMKWLWNQYLQFPGDAGNHYASLNLAPDLRGVAPAVIITAEYDPLHLEAEKYGVLLRNSGVYVVEKRFSGLCHGFLDLPIYDEVQKSNWLQDIKQLLKKLDNLRDDQH
jgi:acetyl esterase